MEGVVNKKCVTIIERVEKKLTNMSVEEIKDHMRTKTDITFNAKK